MASSNSRTPPTRPLPPLVDGAGHVLDGFILGGDISEQLVGDGSRLICCAIVAIPAAALQHVAHAIDRVLQHHTGLTSVTDVEVHANEIWNGSARQKTAFRGLVSKDSMKQFFIHFATAANRECPFVAVAVSECPPGGITERRIAKAALINAAMGRIDNNLRYLTGKHLGQPSYYLDPEADRVTNYADPKRARGYMPEVQALLKGKDVVLYYSVDPTHHETDSKDSRLIQVSDVAAYFVGKYLNLHAALLKQVVEGEAWSERSTAWLADANYCLGLWDLLNVEAVFLLTPDQFKKQAPWMRSITEPYRKIFEAGADLCICSMREAFPRRRLGGVGYWSLQADGLMTIRATFIPAEA